MDPLLMPLSLSQGELRSLTSMPLAEEGYLVMGRDAGSPGSQPSCMFSCGAYVTACTNAKTIASPLSLVDWDTSVGKNSAHANSPGQLRYPSPVQSLIAGDSLRSGNVFNRQRFLRTTKARMSVYQHPGGHVSSNRLWHSRVPNGGDHDYARTTMQERSCCIMRRSPLPVRLVAIHI